MRHPLNGDRLRLEIMKRGLDQGRFAELCGVAPWTISQACRGRAINPKTLSKIIGALVRVPVLMGAEDLLIAVERVESAAVGAR